MHTMLKVTNILLMILVVPAKVPNTKEMASHFLNKNIHEENNANQIDGNYNSSGNKREKVANLDFEIQSLDNELRNIENEFISNIVDEDVSNIHF